MRKLIIVDNAQFAIVNAFPDTVITFETYLREYPQKTQSEVHVINLCDTEKYLSEGYYCSLLAEARNHSVIPKTNIINSFYNPVEITLKSLIASEAERKWLDLQPEDMSTPIFAGISAAPELISLSKKIFNLYPTAILKLTKSSRANTLKLERINLQDIPEKERLHFISNIHKHSIIPSITLPITPHKNSFTGKRRWNMAILVNPNEEIPPSNPTSVQRFVKAANKLGINADVVSANNLHELKKYDALFIRETTQVNHYTYQLACEAEKHGLALVDDPTSILHCSNKVFLHDAFLYHNITTPKTKIIRCNAADRITTVENSFEYPVILKVPDSSCSRGIFKIHSREELVKQLDEIHTHSALSLIQEYFYTDFDWRIGVLNGKALYACRYYMAQNHWKIINHFSKADFMGNADCLPISEVPEVVLSIALRACKIIGDGLYGVDIKVKDNRAYVIEVNDNPNLDYQVEDEYLGDELYIQIMNEFISRIELGRKQ